MNTPAPTYEELQTEVDRLMHKVTTLRQANEALGLRLMNGRPPVKAPPAKQPPLAFKRQRDVLLAKLGAIATKCNDTAMADDGHVGTFARSIWRDLEDAITTARQTAPDA